MRTVTESNGSRAWPSLLSEARIYRLIGLLFERPKSETQAQAKALLAELEPGELQRCGEECSGVSEGHYLALFGPGGPISPREVAWRGRLDPGEILADLGAFYQAFAYRPAAEDPPDHLAVQLGFVAYLRVKEAYARANDAAEEAEVTANAAERFLEVHLRPWVGRVATRLATMELAPFAALSGLLAELIGDCAADDDAPLPGLEDGAPLSCGIDCSATDYPVTSYDV